MTVVAIIVFVMIAIVAFVLISQSKQREKIEQSLKTISGFSPSQMIASANKGIALDQKNQLLAIALAVEDRVETRVFPNHIVTGVDVECAEGKSVTKKTGFVSFTTEKSLESITLCLTLSDKEISLFRIPIYIFVGDKPDATSNLLQQQAMEQANIWHGLLSAMVRTKKDVNPPLIATEITSITSNIESLHRLHQAGALSDQEFQSAKNRLLG